MAARWRRSALSLASHYGGGLIQFYEMELSEFERVCETHAAMVKEAGRR